MTPPLDKVFGVFYDLFAVSLSAPDLALFIIHKRHYCSNPLSYRFPYIIVKLFCSLTSLDILSKIRTYSHLINDTNIIYCLFQQENYSGRSFLCTFTDATKIIWTRCFIMEFIKSIWLPLNTQKLSKYFSDQSGFLRETWCISNQMIHYGIHQIHVVWLNSQKFS